MKCSSLCRMNIGTSQRGPCCSLGFHEYPSVLLSNKLLERSRVYQQEVAFIFPVVFLGTSWRNRHFDGLKPTLSKTNGPLCNTFRTCCLVLLATALGAAWTLEQPDGSVLEFYPAWRTVMQSIFAIAGPRAVSVQHLARAWLPKILFSSSISINIICSVLIGVFSFFKFPKPVLVDQQLWGMQGEVVDATLFSKNTKAPLRICQHTGCHGIGQGKVDKEPKETQAWANQNSWCLLRQAWCSKIQR